MTSDAQIGQSEMEEAVETAERWDSVVTRLLRYVPEAEFLFHLGDHVADAQNTEQYELFLDHLALYRIPLAPIVGNHDIINDYGTGRVGGRNFMSILTCPTVRTRDRASLIWTEIITLSGERRFSLC